MQAFLGDRRLRVLDRIVDLAYFQQPREEFSVRLNGAKWWVEFQSMPRDFFSPQLIIIHTSRTIPSHLSYFKKINFAVTSFKKKNKNYVKIFAYPGLGPEGSIIYPLC